MTRANIAEVLLVQAACGGFVLKLAVALGASWLVSQLCLFLERGRGPGGR